MLFLSLLIHDNNTRFKFMIVLVQQGCRNGNRIYSQDRVEVTLFFLLTSVISTGNIKQLQEYLCYIYSDNVKYI